MLSARSSQALLAVGAFVLAAVLLPAPAAAQTGQVKGKVVDEKNQPVEDATIIIEMIEGMNRKYETKTNRRGEYVQVGLQPGRYRITARKGDMSQSFEQRVRLGTSEVNFTLAPGAVSEEDAKAAAAKVEAMKATFAEGVELTNAGKNDEAIAKFQQVIEAAPKCVECYTNIGTLYTRKQDYAQAEAAFKKAIEIDPEFADAYNGLATAYNAQKKFDEAAQASAKAQELGGAAGETGGNPSTVFNQAVIAWNAGKTAEAKKLFEQTVKLDPKFADAHYWLGMATVNEGKLPEAVPHFEKYLELAPDGQYAAQAKSILESIKKS